MNDRGKYRSKLEQDVAASLTMSGLNFQYEQWKVVYWSSFHGGMCLNCNSIEVGKDREYTPDFYIPVYDVWVESKGKFTPEGRKKILSVLEDDRNDITKENFLLLFQRNNKLDKSAKSTYLEWCEKHNIRAIVFDKARPTDWIKEMLVWKNIL